MSTGSGETPKKGFTRREVLKAGVVIAAAAALGPDSKKPMIEQAPEQQKDDFEQQFEKFSPHEMPAKDGSPENATIVKITEISPPQEEIKNPRTLVFAQAFVHALSTYKNTLRELYKDGRSMLTFDHPRAGGELPDLAADEYEAIKEFAENAPEEVRAAKILLSVLESRNQVQADVLTHSRGLGYTTIAALIDNVRAVKEGRDNRIRNIVASGPNGLIGDDSLLGPGGLALRTLSEDSGQINWGPDFGHSHISMEELAQMVSKERLKKIGAGELSPETETDPTKEFEELTAKKAAAEARGIIEYGPADAAGNEVAKTVAALVKSEGRRYAVGRLDSGAENDGLLSGVGRAGVGIARTYREAEGLSKIKLHDALPKLREIGIGVAIARGTSDKVFPAERIARYMKTLRELGVLDIQMTAVHDTINRDPRAAYILNGVFSDLERQRQTTQ